MNNKIMAARRVQIPVLKVAVLPLPSPLTFPLMMPKRTKSVIKTTRVMSQAMSAMADAATAPQKPEPTARRKAMKLTPQAMGWRIMTRVSALEVSVDARLKSVLSMEAITAAGLYPMCFPVQTSPLDWV